MSDHVRIVEVGPRDGLQNESITLSAEQRIALIRSLHAAGLSTIEAGSFVSPRWVPQMADNAQVMAGIRHKPGVSYPVLVPNMKGLEAALAAGVKEIAVFGAATEAFSLRNTNCSIAESLDRFAPVCEAALAAGIMVRGYISVVLGCPFEGEVKPEVVADVAQRLYQMGCYEISLGDTIGVGTPGKTQRMIEAVGKRIAVEKLGGHYHDTYGQALANVLASLEMGMATFDSSVAGLGGCPYAPGATGNVATEDVVHALQREGLRHDIDLGRLVDLARRVAAHFGRELPGRVYKTGPLPALEPAGAGA